MFLWILFCLFLIPSDQLNIKVSKEINTESLLLNTLFTKVNVYLNLYLL